MTKIKLRALKVSQPLGDFFVISVKASIIKQISFSEPLTYLTEDGLLKGNQRPINIKRLSEIGKYIDTAEMTFPNSIILSVNNNEDGTIIEDNNNRWELINENGEYFLEFPENVKSASIIDGQHRLNGFDYISNKSRLDMEILCSIFFDLPNPYQAYLFATINGNQKKVDKSLALEQFGYFIEKENKESWTPEKLAANIARKLNFEKTSPLYSLIKLAPIYDNDDFIELNKSNWLISTSAMIEGILSLITTNYKRDRIEMMNKKIFYGRDRKMLKNFKDSSPLRNEFLNYEDDFIENTVFIFFQAVNEKIWSKVNDKSYLKKTIGIQVLFDLLKESLKRDRELNSNIIDLISDVDFSDNYFQASGIGKTRIRNVIFILNKLKSIDQIENENDKREILRLIK
ncbi:DGQHR domain-containing protein [Flavobacterium sp. MFBS3-15]|uniref:DGQHR domain-containing protein n=1 Tax=Flavobacterium sp. MFBS3-15 TaxID=2989816 RepID=UPI002236AC58|nr:DGQHR domain-containing protein [Flavobacterium sp. MFBS3-15]MCW4470217.1 DGQHR domain-containing protein [Flavobacterium sp. MFBS3-15]